MRKTVIAFLYPLVALLLIVPPAFASLMSKMCMNPTGGRCRPVTAHDWFLGDLAAIWMPPFALALFLVWVIIRLRKAEVNEKRPD